MSPECFEKRRPTPRLNSSADAAMRFAAVFAALLLSNLSTVEARANVVGNDTQNFNPTTGGLDFVTVQSSETLKPGFINFGLFLNYAGNSLPHFEDNKATNDDAERRRNLRDTILGADLNVGIGVLENWDLGISLPQMLHQDVRSDGGYRGQFSSKGNTEVRVNSKVRVVGDDAGGIAVIGSVNFNRLKNNPYTGKDPGPTYNLELAFDTTIEKVALGANIGYRWRDKGEPVEDNDFPIDPVGNQVIGSVAASYLLPSIDTKVIFEIFGSRPTESTTDFSDRLQSSLEALLGVKHDLTTSLAAHAGFGRELQHGMSSPDWRVYAGINWAIGPEFSRPTQPIAAEPDRKPTNFAKKGDRDPFAGPPKAFEKIIIHDILFEFDSSENVVGSADQTLAKLVAHLNRAPAFKRLVIDGHTDSIGPEAYNEALSERRAKTIRRWLIERHKLDATKVDAEGFGETQPIADNGNFQGRQLNRRVEFRVYR